MEPKKYKVIRPFYIGTKVQKVGDVLELSGQLAAELFSANKVEAFKEAPMVLAPQLFADVRMRASRSAQ